MKNLKTLTLAPIERKPEPLDFVAFDCEGDGSPHGFRLAAVWDEHGGHIFKRKKDLREYLFSPVCHQKRILAANLEYDWSVAFQPFDEHHSILLGDGRWLRASYRQDMRHVFTAWDIQRIAPLAVRDYGHIVGIEKYPTPQELTGGRLSDEGHFTCEAHRRTDCIECYCLRDAQIVYEFARLYQSELNALGGQMKMTAASCSMDLFRRRFLKEEIEPTYVEKNDFARTALYGGRVENFKAGTDFDIRAYDFNSLYPAVLRGLQVGKPGTYHHLNHTQRLAARLSGFGIVRATIEIPPSYIPVLPHRVSRHNYYPTGTVAGTWTFSELRYAIENGGKILESGELIFADETISPFAGFVDTLYARKQAYSQAHDPREKVVKLLLNSLWGKFAQRSDDSLQVVTVPQGKYSLADYYGCEAAELAGREIFLKSIDPRVQSPHVHVPWAAEVTAQARIKLHRMLLEADCKLFYCDTDSVHLDGRLPTGEGLGELKEAYHFRRVTYLAPKEYGGLDEKGKFVGVAKGIPDQYQAAFLRTGHVRFARPQHILEAIRARGRVAEWKMVKKERLAHAPVRDHPDLRDYNHFWVDTRPYDVDAIPVD